MSNSCPTVKVKFDNEQGFFVINEADFDPAVHERFDADEALNSEGLTVAELKEALTAKGVAIPGDAKKADLRALLDAA
jgi:hypothetical protein